MFLVGLYKKYIYAFTLHPNAIILFAMLHLRLIELTLFEWMVILGRSRILCLPRVLRVVTLGKQVLCTALLIRDKQRKLFHDQPKKIKFLFENNFSICFWLVFGKSSPATYSHSRKLTIH